MTAQNLVISSDKLLVFGGVYSNLQALEALQAIAEEEGFAPEEIICTGDIVAYCAQPEECVQAIKAWGISCIAGNVELNLANNTDDCGCNFEEDSRCDLLSRQWYPYAQAHLSPDSIDWMSTLPHYLQFDFGGKKVLVLHGSYQNTSEFIFKSTPWSVKDVIFQETQADVILAGHAGLPFAERQEEKYWLNAGVIGMPANDSTPRVWYLILTKKGSTIAYEIRSLSYDYLQASQKMRAQGLPKSYAETLLTGIWDNCDILPTIETHEQGTPLAF